MINTGFCRELITAIRGISLVGYFNPRPNTGVLDDLFVKALLFEGNGVVGGLVVFDLCFVTTTLIDGIHHALRQRGLDVGHRLIYSATHTHMVNRDVAVEMNQRWVWFAIRQFVYGRWLFSIK